MPHSMPEIYSIKRHGTTLDTCDREPVQTPGCIQAHGALLVLRADDLTIAQASENAAEILGVDVDALFGRPLAQAIDASLAQRVAAALEGQLIERQPTSIGTLPADPPRRPTELDAIVHAIGDQVLLELETVPPSPSPGASNDHYATVKRAISRLRSATSLEAFCNAAAEETRALTGLDRVMIYRFHPDDSGEVIAESRDASLPSWLGLRYPEHDIPKPAREIFKRIWIRPLPDAAGPLVEMRPLAHPDTGRPLEMTHCALRGASVMYSEYLRNMGVAASLTMSIMQGPRLWGLIACHHQTPTYFPHRMRAACEFLSQFVSLHLSAVEEREHLQYLIAVDAAHHAALARAASTGRLAAMLDGDDSVLKGINADGFALLHDGAWATVGETPSQPELAALAPWLRAKLATTDVVAIDALGSAFPEAQAFAQPSGGLMATAPSRGSSSLLCWFRREQVRDVRWAGDPHVSPLVIGPNGPRLTPRGSFDLFIETVRGTSRPWLGVEVGAARRLRTLVGELFIVRAEQLAAVNSELTRSNEELDAFAYVASHDLKEPLRGINRYASKVLESLSRGQTSGAAEQERLNSILRLTTRMDALINSLLHYSRMGRLEVDRDVEDAEVILEEALDVADARIAERGVAIVRPRRLPATVSCDAIRLREIFVNLLTNAAKYNDKPSARIEVGFIAPGELPPATALPTRLPPASAGELVFYVADNGIGIDPQHHARVFELFKRLHARDDFGGGSGAGLTIVRRLIEQHGGRIWIESQPRVGTTFYFTLGTDRPGEATMGES